MKYICYTKSKFITSKNWHSVMTSGEVTQQQVDEANDFINQYANYQTNNSGIEYLTRPDNSLHLILGCYDLPLAYCDLFWLAQNEAAKNNADILILTEGQFYPISPMLELNQLDYMQFAQDTIKTLDSNKNIKDQYGFTLQRIKREQIESLINRQALSL